MPASAVINCWRWFVYLTYSNKNIKLDYTNIQNRLITVNQSINYYYSQFKDSNEYKEYINSQEKLKEANKKLSGNKDFKMYKGLLIEKRYLESLLKNKWI